MTMNFGVGVTRTLDPAARQFSNVVFQISRPPLDSELNLQDSIHGEELRQALQRMMPSGFFLDPTRGLTDYQFAVNNSNLFILGNPKVVTGAHESLETQPIVWAAVNGWIIPVAGTENSVVGDLRNIIKLYPPPQSNGRVDLAFLEVWQTRVDANPSVVNKPTASKLWHYGNVKYGGLNIDDDLEDPSIGFDTTARIQVQYRIRVYGSGGGWGGGAALDVYPDGLGDPNILGQGTATLPVGGFYFTNMRETLGDPSLWRAGDGDYTNNLGTVDGYVYAVPICAIFRRSSSVYEAVNPAGAGTQNGAFNRTPGTALLPDPLTGARVLTIPNLTATLPATAGITSDAIINVTDLNGSGLEDSAHVLAGTFLVIDQEIVGISNVNIPAGTITIPMGGRGRWGTAIVGHAAKTLLSFFNTRPDGLYADQVAETDILDLRRAVNANDWDYARLLEHNVASLMKGTLRSTWKMSATGDTQGVTVHEVDYLCRTGAQPVNTMALDGPDGIRMVWSDAAALQPDLTILLDNNATQDNNNVGLTNANTFDATVGYAWDVGPDFHPSGFMNVGAPGTNEFCNGTTLLFFLGGNTGEEGIRGTFRTPGTRAVRAVMPKEYWKSKTSDTNPANGNQNPITIRFLDQRAFESAPAPLVTGSPTPPAGFPTMAARHVGPMYPYSGQNFEKPFIALGGLLWGNAQVVVPVTGGSVYPGTLVQLDLGVNFDTDGVFAVVPSGRIVKGDSLDPANVSVPLLRETRTLYDMLTNGGLDQTGDSSEVYLVIYGDNVERSNNGAFRVVGAGTIGYTEHDAAAATQVILQPLSTDYTAWDPATGKNVTVEFRSPYHNSDDTSSYTTKVADLALVLTDIGGTYRHPWYNVYLGYGAGDGYDLSMPLTGFPTYPAVASDLLVSMTLMYHPGRGGEARVPDQIVRFALRGGATVQTVGAYLRQDKAAIDTTFSSATGMPTDETYWDPAHVQLWNRLPSMGLHAPQAPVAGGYGGNVVGFSEQDREHELFVDRGSKTIIFRPFRDRAMTMQELTYDILRTDVAGAPCLLGAYDYPNGIYKDCGQMFTGTAGSIPSTGKRMGFAVPREFMPRFGRQDIPYYQDQDHGTGPFLSGINHLFRDAADRTDVVFNIIGGAATTSGVPAVNPMLFITGICPAPPGVPVSVPYAASGTTPAITNNRPFIGARRVSDLDPAAPFAQEIIDKLAAVNSSDLGHGLRGIQLPPYYGIARLYGVYDARDFVDKGGRTYDANRIDPEADPAPNLLREDACEQTLFILQNGAQDFTTPVHVATAQLGDHTYIIPSNVLDLTRSLSYAPGDTVDNMHFVVECATFGFTRGFIDQNNYVLVRKFSGTGYSISRQAVGNTDGDDLVVQGVHMILPCAAGLSNPTYVAYNRTVYQGDPYGSRTGDIKTASDYEVRYGQLSVGAQYSLRWPIQQFDASGNFVPEIPNARAFEILASQDFYTTMGTGKIGGMLYPGTMLDVGYTEDTVPASKRYPAAVNSYPWRVLPRTYTEGQKESTNRASLRMTLLDNDALNPQTGEWVTFVVHKLDGTEQTLYASTVANAGFLTALFSVPATDIFTVDVASKVTSYPFTYTGGGTVAPGAHGTATKTVPGALVGDSVVLTLSTLSADPLTYLASVTAPDTVTVWIVNTWPSFPFKNLYPDHMVVIANTVTPNVPAHSVVPLAATIPYTGADTTKDQLVIVKGITVAQANGLVFTGYVTAPNTITVECLNTTAVQINAGNIDLAIVVLESTKAIDHTYASQSLAGMVLHSSGDTSITAENMAYLINGHANLQDIIKAEVFETQVTLTAVPTGAEGNGIQVRAEHFYSNIVPLPPFTNTVEQAVQFDVPKKNSWISWIPVTSSNLLGGVDYPYNAGDGTNQLRFTGMIERLPLGCLLQDSDFLCENPLNDTSSAVKTSPAGPRPLQTAMPLTFGGEEYDRFFGEPGELLAMADGSVSVTNFAPWRTSIPGGSRVFRLYRGGGPTYVLTGTSPGGPVDWTVDTLQPSEQPVLKGGVLMCRAMLVRNYYEEISPMVGSYPVTNGDELQMVVMTYGILGDGSTQEEGLEMNGLVSPSGYGEGYAAADRYRIMGRPMLKEPSRQVPDPATVTLAIYPDGLRG